MNKGMYKGKMIFGNGENTYYSSSCIRLYNHISKETQILSF